MKIRTICQLALAASVAASNATFAVGIGVDAGPIDYAAAFALQDCIKGLGGPVSLDKLQECLSQRQFAYAPCNVSRNPGSCAERVREETTPTQR
ncbi:hypothetical protein [Burkholderia ubonensis]|uniref:hypothetical protein n=1 Tax=Burkholderia ubonensis TaxID=101571 RepID=UPI002AAF28CC|nr:hypothetical protein [Burkholderia ubonensis]